MQVQLTQEQLKNLVIFLNRAQLQGSEVGAFMDIVNILKLSQIKKVEKDVKPTSEPKK